MKNLFFNTVGKNTAKLYFSNKKNNFSLYFHLSDNPVQHIWQKIHLNANSITTGIHHNCDINELIKELNNNCDYLSIDKLEIPITQDKLNLLHNQYVLSNKNKFWQNINHLIHIIESKINSILDEYDSSIIFYSDENNHYPLKEEFKMFLNSDIVWGRMILGYGTLGKDWSSIAKDNDSLDDLCIQSTISSETRLLFCPEQVTPLYNQQKFYDWAINSNLPVPLTNLNELSLGRYVLGQIIITDELLSYHNNPSDWYVPNHYCKLTWNKEIFTKDTMIEKIEFSDTDMYYDSLLRHTDFKNLNA